MTKTLQIQSQSETPIEAVLTAVENFVMGRISSVQLSSALFSAGLEHDHDNYDSKLQLCRSIKEHFLGFEDDGSHEHPVQKAALIPNTPEAKKVAFENFSRDCHNVCFMLRLEGKLQTIQQRINHSDDVLNHGSSDSVSSCCIIMQVEIKYDNPFLNNNSLLDVFNQGGIDAVNLVLGSQGIIGSSKGNDSDFS